MDAMTRQAALLLTALAVSTAAEASQARTGERLMLAQILNDRPISGSLNRPSIGGNRTPDMLLRPDTQTEIIQRRRIIMPQQEVCRLEPVLRNTERGTRRETVRRCYLVPAR
jgi:hypothetical protein